MSGRDPEIERLLKFRERISKVARAKYRGEQPMEGRSPADVAKQILDLVPEQHESFREDIERLLRDFSYRAPELAQMSWFDLSDSINKMLGGEKPTKEWQIRICEILTTQTREELGLEVKE